MIYSIVMLSKWYVNAWLYSGFTMLLNDFYFKFVYLTLVLFVTFIHNHKFRNFKKQIRICDGGQEWRLGGLVGNGLA